MNKPTNIEEYKNWLKDFLGVELDNKYETYYNTVSTQAKIKFESTPFWTDFVNNIPNYKDDYLMRTKYNLLKVNEAPELLIKSFDSFLLKTFRKNVLKNNNWPDEPTNGWYTPDNWFERINDLIRTTISVKYLDGVEYMVESLKEIAKKNNLSFESDFEAREEGYYAAHTYVSHNLEIPHQDWDTQSLNFKIEIQVTTQLQEVIKTLLHKHYADNRKKIKKSNSKWQWDYSSQEFATNYLGHILHYVEGMIMEIRDKNKK